uniref:Uncharacterized protein n=1 Tax=Lygus hesperus TaxID=30085 RepID=A0A146KKI9_LYGHE
MSPKSAMRPHQRRTYGPRYQRKTSLQGPHGVKEAALEEEDQQPRSQSVEELLDTSSRSPSPERRLHRTVSEEQLSAPQRRRSCRLRSSPPPEDTQDTQDEVESETTSSATTSVTESKKRNFVDRLASKVRSMMRK